MIKKFPLVSVLMTTYNREKYLAEAVESVLASTYNHFELIIVDDRSKDKSVSIANEYAKLDQRVKVYVNEVNLGDYANRNKAASYAKGKYLKYVDADDLIYPFGLEQLVYYMEQFPEAAYGLCSLKQDQERMFPFQLSPVEAYRYHYFGSSLFHKAPLSSIIRNDVFKKEGGFTGKQHVGDFELWHKLSGKYPVVLMPHGKVWYREHDDQQMNDNRTNAFVPFKYYLVSQHFLKASDCPLSKEEKEKALRRVSHLQSVYILSAIKHKRFAMAKEMSRLSGISYLKAVYCYLKK